MEKVLSILNTSLLFIGSYLLLLLTIVITRYTKSWNIIKKVLIVSGIVLGIGAIIIVASFSNLKTKEKSYWKEITLSEYYKLNEDSTENLIYIGRPTCSHCQAFTPKIKAVANAQKVTINYFDLDQITDDTTFNEFKASNSVLSTDDWGTPLVILVKNKTVIDAISGDVESSAIEEFFTKNNLGE